MTPLLQVTDVAISGRLEPTSLALAASALAAVVGPNGSGKTSLLRAIAGIERSAGAVRVAGESLDTAPPAHRRALMSFLPASREVTWPISVRDVIALGLSAPDPARVTELIELLELDRLADRPVDRLSTGERARVLLARALAPRPRLLLLDEPLSNLDPYWVLRTLEVVQGATALGAAALVSVHDLTLLSHFDHALLVHDGRMVLAGPPAEVCASTRFGETFRVRRVQDGWRIAR